MSCSWDIEDNIKRAEQLVREAAAQGAKVVLLQELFETPYFCIEQNHAHLALARSLEDSSVVQRMQALSTELGVVLPVSFLSAAGLVSLTL